MDIDKLHAWTAAISKLFEQRLRVKGPTLSRQVDRAGRLVPRRLRAEARYLAEADLLAQNPKLYRMVDMAHARRAHDALTEWLRGVDPKASRRARMLDRLTLIAFNLLLLAVALVGVLVWRGIL